MQIQENNEQDKLFSKYTPTDWKNGLTPLNEANLNKIEQALVRLLGEDEKDTEYIVAKILENIEEEVRNREAGDTNITNVIGDGFTTQDTVAKKVANAQTSADKANDSIGGSFNKTNTVANELQAVKGQANKGVEDAASAQAKADANGDAIDGLQERVADVESELGDEGWVKTDITAAQTTIDTHAGNQENPHGVTKAQIELENVDNKSVETIKSEFTGEISNSNNGFVTGGNVFDYLSNYYTQSQTEVFVRGLVNELSGLDNYYTKDEAIGTGEYVTIDCGSSIENIN